MRLGGWVVIISRMATISETLATAIEHQHAGRLQAAAELLTQVLQTEPDQVDVLHRLGRLDYQLGRVPEAIAAYRRAVELEPEFAEAHYDLGNALKAEGKLHHAAASYRQAVEHDPSHAGAHANLGLVLADVGKLDEAVACCRRALALKPDCAEVYCHLGKALKYLGRLDEAIASYRRALELKPDYAKAHSNLLFGLQYRAGVTPAELAEAHAAFDLQHAASLRSSIVPRESARDPAGPLRLGFVSPDLGRHPVGYFLVPVLENLAPEQAETVVYSDRTFKDDMTVRLQAAASEWHDVFRLSNEALAERIRADGIDVLFDLAGHTRDGRLLVFAHKPAPVQVTWAGYAGTTGLRAMDYILADRFEIPPGAECYYQERVLRMPDGYVCYDPPAYAPPVIPLPAAGRGVVSFGCFNNLAKLTPQVVEVWARILRRTPGSQLVLKYRGGDERSVVERFVALFAAHKVDRQRLVFLGSSLHTELLFAYQQIDIALDPFPYSGGLTTCEALWMGVPVVTCPFDTFASRHSLSHLSNVGLTETIARDLDEYVGIAVSLANDETRLAELRTGLRERMARSPLCDGKRFATNLVRLLREVSRI